VVCKFLNLKYQNHKEYLEKIQKGCGDMDILTKCFIKETDFVTREVAGETIIVPIRGNVGDLNSIYTLNEVGTKIWELIDGKNSVSK
jgi:hypothetical protein